MTLLGLIPSHDPHQSLRVRRFLMAAVIYAAAVVLMGVYTAMGLMRPRDWLVTAAVIAAVNLVIFLVLRTGRNERLRDPSLTGVQMFAACLLMALALFYVDRARGGLLLIMLVLLMFGAFRLRMGAFLALGLFGVLCYGVVLFALMQLRPATVDLRVEVLQLAALAAVVPCGGFFVGYVGELRRQLRARQVDLQRANETAHELAVQDSLTGVSNRASIVRFVDEERERSDRLELPLSVALVDLDRFKVLNHEHGHEVGDRVLVRVAGLLRDGIRTVDGVGRYGGEEFLLVMPDTASEAAHASLERLRAAIADCRMEELAPGLRLTVSVGVAEYDGEPRVWSLIERARRAADAAYEAGGNRVVGPRDAG